MTLEGVKLKSDKIVTENVLAEDMGIAHYDIIIPLSSCAKVSPFRVFDYPS